MQLQDKTIKNCCKICRKPVKKKDGIQCQGMCKKWVHYKCLCYTPGKIADIKSGVLKVLCPCPDCCAEPKEVVKLKCKNNSLEPIKSNRKQIINQCECLKRSNNKNSESGTEDTFMWRKSRFPPFGAPYGFNIQMENSDTHCQKSQAIRLQSWSLIDIQGQNKPCVHKAYQSNMNTTVPPFKSQSSTTCQTSIAQISDSSVTGSPGMLDTLEQMCTTVTFLAEQIMQIKERLAEINSSTSRE